MSATELPDVPGAPTVEEAWSRDVSADELTNAKHALPLQEETGV